jgi:hypothetical protein
MQILGILMPFAGAMLLLLVLAIMIAGKADKGREAVKTGDGAFEFTPNRRSYWGTYAFIALFGGVAVLSLVNSLGHGGSLTVTAICSGFVLLLLRAFPATIVVNERGLEQLYWLRGRKRLAWAEVVDVDANEKKGEVKITGKHGLKIVHTRQLPDRTTFLAEVGKHRSEAALVSLTPAPPAVNDSELNQGLKNSA